MDHDKTDAQPDEPMVETILLAPGGVMGVESTWEPEHKQETSFGGNTQSTRLKEAQVEGLYQRLSNITCQTPEVFILLISNSEVANCTTETKACP